ncbi:MAG: hypothetical protein ACK559_36400, partial [bacterium]
MPGLRSRVAAPSDGGARGSVPVAAVSDPAPRNLADLPARRNLASLQSQGPAGIAPEPDTAPRRRAAGLD